MTLKSKYEFDYTCAYFHENNCIIMTVLIIAEIQGCLKICDPLCEIQAKVSKSNYEIQASKFDFYH